MVFRYPDIQGHYNEAVICPDFKTPKILNFPFGTNGKFIIFSFPIFKHIMVCLLKYQSLKHVCSISTE